jgi:hypothetical protein
MRSNVITCLSLAARASFLLLELSNVAFILPVTTLKVPGLTRGVVPLLAKAGVLGISVGTLIAY